LILRPDRRVGNQVITSCIVHALVTQRPEIELHYLAPEGRQDLLEGLPGLTKVHVLPRRPASKLPAMFSLIRSLRNERFDVAIDASHWHSFSLTSALLTRLVGARWSIGHERPGAAALLDQRVEVPHDGDWPAELAVKLSLLSPLGIEPQEPRTNLPDAAGEDSATRWWAEHASGPGRVLLWPSTRKASTEVPGGLWPHLLEQLPLPGRSTVAVGWGPGEEGMAKQLVGALQEAGFSAAILPDTSISELAHFMHQADVVVSGDTGPMHVAGACAASVLGIFRNDDGARWLPRSPNNRGFTLLGGGELQELQL
jgi:ADP-heptose:LPS heptosyltransferase